MPRPSSFFCSMSVSASTPSPVVPMLVGRKAEANEEVEERILISQVELLGIDGELKSVSELAFITI